MPLRSNAVLRSVNLFLATCTLRRAAGSLPSQIRAAAKRAKIELPDGWKASCDATPRRFSTLLAVTRQPYFVPSHSNQLIRLRLRVQNLDEVQLLISDESVMPSHV